MTVPYQKILLPLDGSEVAAQALPHAEALAACHKAKLILLEIVEDPTRFVVAAPGASLVGAGSSGPLGVGAYLPDEEAHNRAMDEAKRSLEEMAASLRHRKITAEADIDTGDPAECIVDYAAEHNVDLIVMSTHGRTGIQRWAYGSVATKVLQAAACPVLIVRPTAGSN